MIDSTDDTHHHWWVLPQCKTVNRKHSCVACCLHSSSKRGPMWFHHLHYISFHWQLAHGCSQEGGHRLIGLKGDLVHFTQWGHVPCVHFLPSHDLPSPTGKTGWVIGGWLCGNGGAAAFQHSLPSFQESRKSLFAYTISFPHHRIVEHCLAILIQYLFSRLPFISIVFVASTRMCLSSSKWGCFWEERMFWLVLTTLEHYLRFRTWSWG